jgi:hypothetical protein
MDLESNPPDSPLSQSLDHYAANGKESVIGTGRSIQRKDAS